MVPQQLAVVLELAVEVALELAVAPEFALVLGLEVALKLALVATLELAVLLGLEVALKLAHVATAAVELRAHCYCYLLSAYFETSYPSG